MVPATLPESTRSGRARTPPRLARVKTLVIGTGGREHALALALSRDPSVTEVHAAPGNPGDRRGRHAARRWTRSTARPWPPWPTDLGVDLVVVGPEAPLVAGVADAVRAARDQLLRAEPRGGRAGGLEGLRQGRDGGGGRADRARARVHDARGGGRLRSTRSVRRTSSRTTGSPPARASWSPTTAKPPSPTRRGASASSSSSTSTGPRCRCSRSPTGSTVYPLQPAQDFKRIFDGDEGPNTGGMGAYTPLPWAPEGLVEEVLDRVLQPTVDEMARRGTPFAGLLYAGLALTAQRAQGGRVQRPLRRPGDPGPDGAARLAARRAAQGRRRRRARRRSTPPRWKPGGAVAVVMASARLPGDVQPRRRDRRHRDPRRRGATSTSSTPARRCARRHPGHRRRPGARRDRGRRRRRRRPGEGVRGRRRRSRSPAPSGAPTSRRRLSPSAG